MSEESMDSIVQKAEAEARQSAAQMAEEARARAVQLPPISADPLPRTEAPEKERPQLERRENRMAFQAAVRADAFGPDGGGDSGGASGTLRFVDCDGAVLFDLQWVNGLIVNTGASIIQVGDCDGGGSSPGSSYSS